MLLLSLFSSPRLQAQSEVDDLRRKLNKATGRMAHELTIDLAKAYYQINPDSTIQLATQLLRQEGSRLSKMTTADAHNVLSTALQLQGRLSEALIQAQKAEDIYLEINDSSGVSSVLSNMGTIYFNRSNYQLALDHYLRALRLKEALGQENGVAGLKCNIGNIYVNQKQFEQARKHYTDAQEVFIRLGNKRGISYTHNNLGLIYEETGELERAIGSYINAFEIDKELGDRFGMASSFYNLGEIYRKTNRLSLAKEHYTQSLQIAQEISSPIGIARTLNGLASIHLRASEYNSSIQQASAALEIAKTAQDYTNQLQSLQILTESFDRMNQPSQSLKYFKELAAVKDIIRGEEASLILAETQARYETERKEQELVLSEKNKSLLDARLNRQKLLNKVYIGAIGISLLLLFFIINQYQLIRKNQDNLRRLNASLEEKVNERTRDLRQAFEKAERADRLKTFFLANINHELRTPMNGIIGMSEYLKESLQSPEIKQVADGLLDSSKRLSETMSAIIELSNTEAHPENLPLEAFNPEQLVYNVIQRFEGDLQLKGLKLDFVNYAGDISLVSHAGFVQRILSNLVQNAIKFTEQGYIKIELIRELWAGQPTFCFRVQDSGVGIPANNLKEIFEAFRTSDDQLARGYEGLGIGLTLSRKYAELLQGQISVDSREGQGSVFTLRLPLQ
ncbi:MAG: tetratricopeptide repeat protein [Sphingobacteriaceae bacterium]|nr:tetratricopeptide repeat protein [Sphingobacteriaceae bacterium]